MRAVYASDVAEEMEFARKAAAYFAKDPKCATYTDGEIEPGCFLAIRWGLGDDCVVVIKLDDQHVPTNYMELVRAAASDVEQARKEAAQARAAAQDMSKPCSQDEWAAGRSASKTCARCGLAGPCTGQAKAGGAS